MSGSEDKVSEFFQFVETVKAKIPVDQLYTKLTGEQFEKIDARHRAKIVWREDKKPSLSYFANENILTDFTDTNPKTGKFRSYNPIDILRKCGGACTFSHALQMACEIANVDIPEKFQKHNEEGKLDKRGFYVGKKLLEVWQACKDNAENMILNQSKRPANMTNFFKTRNIPFDINFIRAVNIGICPDYDITHHILEDTDILKKGKGKELNIYSKALSDNALVFPLYNIDGALCGLRFRQFDEKNFAEWIPVDTPCFFNGNRFRNRPEGRRTLIVEGEMNLIAYARAVYNEVKDGDNVQKQLEDALTIIFATGSKSNFLDIFNGLISKMTYLQDHDVKEVGEVPDPVNHPVLKTIEKVSNEIDCNDMLVVDWASLSYSTSKYDIENYLQYHNYQIVSLKDLPTISLPRYALNVMRNYIDSIDNPDNKRQNQINFSFLISEKIRNIAQRQLFDELVSKEFSLSDSTKESLKNHDRNVAFGSYSIDALGRIIETTIDDQNVARTYPKTNFYLRIGNEINFYNLTNTIDKFYEVEVVIGNQEVRKGEVPAGDITDTKIINSFAATVATVSDLVYFDPKMRDNFKTIVHLMNTIPIPKRTHIFASLGRPNEEKLKGELLKTEKFFLMPKISVVDGKIVENETLNIDVNPEDRKGVIKTRFKFKKLDDDEYREAARLLWNHLRFTNDTQVIDSFIGLAVDCCTREIQGYGIVENEHGFPIYLSGQSGAYKTTAAIAGQCLFGDFTTGSDLLAWNQTSLALLHCLTTTGTALHTLDDLKVDELKGSDFVTFIHTLYGGQGRARMNVTGTDRKGGNTVRSSLIITSEGLPADMQESIAARMIALRIVKPPDAIAKEREIHLRKMQEIRENGETNYHLMSGVLPRFIAWAHERGFKPYALSTKKYKMLFTEILESVAKNNIERPADMVTRLVVGFEQFCIFAKEHEFCTEFEADTAFNNLLEYWKVKIINQIKRIETHSSTYKVVNILCQIILSEGIGIKTYRNNHWQEDKKFRQVYPIYDISYPDERGRKLIVVSPKAVLNVMNNMTENGNHIIEDKFVLDLKENGLIEVDETGSFKKFPKPDEKNGSIKEHITARGFAIDYEKLMKLYEDIK